MHGPERIALVGRNGAGKTSLLRTLTGELAPLSGEARTGVPLRFLPQRLDVLDEELSVAANVARLAPGVTDNHIRSQLARFLFKGARAEQPHGHPVGRGTLPGRPRGDHARGTGSAVAHAGRAHQQPRHGQRATADERARLLPGALLIASHDLAFLESAGITRWLLLGEEIQETSAEEVRDLLEAPEAG